MTIEGETDVKLGADYNGTATLKADDDQASYSGSVDYGDGSEAESIGLEGNSSAGLNHTYQAAGSYTVSVHLSNGDHSLDASATVSVQAPTLAVSDATADEGENLVFTVSLGEAWPVPVTVQYWTEAATDVDPSDEEQADPGVDFSPIPADDPQSFTFAAGETSYDVTIATDVDDKDTLDKVFDLAAEVTMIGVSA